MEGPTSAPFASVRLQLAKLRINDELTLVEACEKAVRISAATLGIARAGIWIFDEAHTRLRCVALHDTRSASVTTIQELYASEFPIYIAALRDRRWIAATDARADAATRELKDAYLDPQGIIAMLDAPIFRGDEVFGIVCHEHDAPREWSEHDRAFAGTMADILALLLEQAGHLVSERRRRGLEAERRHAQKLELVARMALSVAHDVNNVLTTVQLLVSGLAGRPESAGIARDVLAALQVGAGLTRELLEIARQQPDGAPEPADIVATTSGLMSLLRAMTRGQATVAVSLPDSKLVVAATANQIQQILLNLVVNARDAIKNGGQITISIEAHLREGRPMARLRVADTGTGLSEEVRRRLFEPFFSTKQGGTGWGLTIVREIVEAAAGIIEVESVLGDGTTFDVWLPLATQPSEPD